MRLNLINRSTASIANVIGVGPAGPEGPPGDAGPAGAPGGSDASFAGWIGDDASDTRAALDSTYVPQLVPSLGTVKVLQAAENPSTWGIELDKSSASRVGGDSGCVSFRIAGDRKWVVGMDVSDVDFVPVYDDDGDGGGSGDSFRVSPGGKYSMGRHVGTSNRAIRFHLLTDDGDADLGTPLLTVQHISIDSASSATYAFKVDLDGVENFGITTSGRLGVGFNPTNSASAWLEVKTGALFKAGVGDASFLQFITSGNATNRTWNLQVAAADGHLTFRDNTGSKNVAQFQQGAAANTLIVGSNYLWLGASTSKLGFFGSTGVVKGSVTGSRGGNAALASLLTLLASHGLITDSSTA